MNPLQHFRATHPTTHFWLGLAICATLGLQSDALAADGNTADWHGYAPNTAFSPPEGGFNESVDWVPPPPGPYPNGPIQRAPTMSPAGNPGPGYGSPPAQMGPYGSPNTYAEPPMPPEYGPPPMYRPPMPPMNRPDYPPMNYPSGPNYGPPPAQMQPYSGPAPYAGPPMPPQYGPPPMYRPPMPPMNRPDYPPMPPRYGSMGYGYP